MNVTAPHSGKTVVVAALDPRAGIQCFARKANGERCGAIAMHVRADSNLPACWHHVEPSSDVRLWS
jgi:hypothetical protein